MPKEGKETATTQGSYDIKREGGEDILYLNYLGMPFVPIIAENPPSLI